MGAPGLQPGLERIQALLNEMGNPQQGLPYIHVAGTNGKGSTSLILARILQESGYRVGRFSSPHLHSYQERFEVNGTPIEFSVLGTHLREIGKAIAGMCGRGYERPTEFEILTALAFLWFKEAMVDVAVLEVGMGGRYDATNIGSPLVSIITSIGLDHTEYLGHSLEEVAGNKAGIIKPAIPVVVGELPPPAQRVVEQVATDQCSPWFFSSSARVLRTGSNGLTSLLSIDFAGQQLKGVPFSLTGDFQLENLRTALTALKVLMARGWQVPGEALYKGLGTLYHPGRMEVVEGPPLVVLDVAHNPQGAEALSHALQNLFPDRQRVLLVGVLDDKDVKAILAPLEARSRLCIVTRPHSSRARNWQRVKEAWDELHLSNPALLEEDITRAAELARSKLRFDEYLLVTGSFYVLDTARRYLMTT